ncbi:MAG: non-heme iron oxygenase ferredoxin subunit [Panacagrimonas sp.]
MATKIKAGRFEELPDGEMRVVDGTRGALGICRVGECAYAFENRCTHEAFALTEGYLEGSEVECTLHGARFCVKTGAVKTGPAKGAIRVFPVRIAEGVMEVEWQPEAPAGRGCRS